MEKNISYITRITLIISLLISSVGISSAQNIERVKEDRQAALQFLDQMYQNPKTGAVPSHIRKAELEFNERLLSTSSTRKAETESVELDWKVRGPFNQGGRTRAVAIDARNENIILAGGVSGGMFRTTDGGKSWARVSNPLDNPAITGVAQDPTAPNTWYYITGETYESINTTQNSGRRYIGDGVYKSTDNGVNWNQLASTDPEDDISLRVGQRADWQLCSDIAIDEISGAIFVANDGGIYRSADDGTSWTKVINAKAQRIFGDICHIDIAKTNTTGSVMYATTHSSGVDKGFYRSTDGISWSKLDLPSGFSGFWQRIVLSIAPSNPDVVWFLAYGGQLSPSTNMLLKYTHSSNSWTNLTSKIPNVGGAIGDFNTQGSYNMVIKVLPSDENTVFVGDTKLWRSTDGFTSSAEPANASNTKWIGGYSPDNTVFYYPNHHPDVHTLVFFPGDSKNALCGHDGGISVTRDILANNGVPPGRNRPHPVTWEYLNNGLFTTQAYAVSIDPFTSGSNEIVAGFQDNGSLRATQSETSSPWEIEPFGGDGGWNAIAPGGERRYISTQFGAVRARPANQDFFPVGTGSTSTNMFISPFILDRTDKNVMYYAARSDLWRNTRVEESREAWKKISFTGNKQIEGFITAMETSISPANKLYLGTTIGKIYKIEKANGADVLTLNDISSNKGLSIGFVSSIDIDSKNADHIIVTFSNYGVRSIFSSDDGGETWDDVSGNLEENADGSGTGPAIRWGHIFKTLDNSNIYFAGATTGLYSTDKLDGSKTQWKKEGATTIGNVPVSMIKSRQNDGLVVVATHGKGVFSAKLSDAVPADAPIEAISFLPADDAVRINRSQNLSIAFNKSVSAGEGQITIKKLANDEVFSSFNITDDNIFVNGQIVNINTTKELDPFTQYYVQISEGALVGINGKIFEGINDKETWNFRSLPLPESIAPLVASLEPENNSRETEVSGSYTIKFNENIHIQGGTIILRKASDNRAVGFVLSNSDNIKIQDSTATITFPEELDPSTQYFMTISSNAFEDEIGNSFAGISDKSVWTFSTKTVASAKDSKINNLFDVKEIQGGLSVTFHNKNTNYAEIGIYDFKGRMATPEYKSNFKNNSANVKANLTEGSYILVVSTKYGTHSQKIVLK